MDVHNQQLVFPTVVVCPMEPYETNRTFDLAFTYLGWVQRRQAVWADVVVFLTTFFVVCSVYDDENVDVIEPFLKYLPQLNYNTVHDAYIESMNITRDPRLQNNVNRKPLRSMTFQVNNKIIRKICAVSPSYWVRLLTAMESLVFALQTIHFALCSVCLFMNSLWLLAIRRDNANKYGCVALRTCHFSAYRIYW